MYTNGTYTESVPKEYVKTFRLMLKNDKEDPDHSGTYKVSTEVTSSCPSLPSKIVFPSTLRTYP